MNESFRYLASAHVLTEDKQLLKVQAHDVDSGPNARLLYEIVDATEEINQRFFIDSYTGAIGVKPGDNLFNYDLVKEYQFKVSYSFIQVKLASMSYLI